MWDRSMKETSPHTFPGHIFKGDSTAVSGDCRISGVPVAGIAK